MWPFKNKKNKTPIEIKKEIQFKKETYEVSRTLINYKLLDGRQFDSWYYGHIDQYVGYGNPSILGISIKTEPVVGPVTSISSLSVAQGMLRIINTSNYNTIVDDKMNPQRSICGQATAAEIIKTEPFKLECDVAYLVETKG